MQDSDKKLIFIDDSGDPGFRGTSSRYFLMTAVAFNDTECALEVDRLISHFRISLGWSENAEFKFRKTNKLIIRQLLNLVSKTSFEVYSVYVGKSKYRSIMPLMNKKKFYDWMIEELINVIPFNEAKIMINGAADKKTRLRTASYIRHKVNVEGRRIKALKIVDSRRDNLIQLADLLSGTLGRSLKSDKTDAKEYIEIVRNKIVKFQEILLENHL